MCECIWIVRALVVIPAALWFIFPVYHLSVGTQIVLTNAKTRRGKHVTRAIKYSKLKRTRCMRFWHLETKTCKGKHKLVQWDNRSGEKLQGFTKTSEDRQQTMQSLIMKGSCERVRFEGIRGVRVVWEQVSERHTGWQMETVVRCVNNPGRQSKKGGKGHWGWIG